MDRPGGYVRVIKTGTRLGDGAETAMIELVDFNEVMLEAKSATPAKKKVRRGRGKSTPVAATETTAEATTEGDEA
jgi:large subunit ribosomal protein L17